MEIKFNNFTRCSITPMGQLMHAYAIFSITTKKWFRKKTVTVEVMLHRQGDYLWEVISAPVEFDKRLSLEQRTIIEQAYQTVLKEHIARQRIAEEWRRMQEQVWENARREAARQQQFWYEYARRAQQQSTPPPRPKAQHWKEAVKTAFKTNRPLYEEVQAALSHSADEAKIISIFMAHNIVVSGGQR